MPEPCILLCIDPLSPRSPDSAFHDEAEIADRLGLRRLLVDHDTIERGSDTGAALRRATADGPGTAVYRGWMMSAEAYGRLFAALSERGIRLINTPEHYAACHHLPVAHVAVGRWMPQTAWIGRDRIDDDDALLGTLAPFGGAAVTVKDWVKSQAAGYWSEACFIPDAADRAAVRRVVGRFIELQGDSLTGGLASAATSRSPWPAARPRSGAASCWTAMPWAAGRASPPRPGPKPRRRICWRPSPGRCRAALPRPMSPGGRMVAGC